jgi:hypothetical protein
MNLSILFICFAYNDVLSQNGGVCIYMLPDSSIQCNISGNSGMGSQNACMSEAIAAGAIPIDCLNTPVTSCATWYATNGVACFYGGLGGCGGSTGACGIIALPIEMGDFWGESTTEGNVLYWTTITELDNDYFNLSYSQDGIDFIVLTQIKGAGSSQSPKNYRFIHTSPLVGVGYYKITQFDYNGESEEFPIIAINRLIKGILFSDIFPNPSTNVFFFNIMEVEIDNYNNSQSISFDLNGVNKGIYLVKITQGNNSETKRLLLH